MGENQNAALWIVATDDRTAMKMLQYMPLCGIVICWYVVTMQHCRDGVCIVGAEVFAKKGRLLLLENKGSNDCNCNNFLKHYRSCCFVTITLITLTE